MQCTKGGRKKLTAGRQIKLTTDGGETAPGTHQKNEK